MKKYLVFTSQISKQVRASRIHYGNDTITFWDEQDNIVAVFTKDYSYIEIDIIE